LLDLLIIALILQITVRVFAEDRYSSCLRLLLFLLKIATHLA